MTDRKETVILLNAIFIFGIFDYFVEWNVFPEPVEIAMLLGRGIKEISGINLANCESLVSSIRGLRVRYVCLRSVDASN